MRLNPESHVRDIVLAVAAVVVVVGAAYTVHTGGGRSTSATTTAVVGQTLTAGIGTSPTATPTASDQASPQSSSGDSPTATATATPTPSGTPTPSATRPTTLAQVRSVLDQSSNLTVSVLGDATGDSSTDWVTLWAKELGASRSVRLHSWLPDSQSWSSNVVTFGSADQPEVSIWNCSQPDAKANYPAGRVDQVQPKKPDLVLYSFGHNDSAGTVIDHLSSTIAAVQKHWASEVAGVVILQNPGRWGHRDGQAKTLSALAAWAASSDQPTIDVATAFRESPRPSAALMRDDTSPNAAGSRLWEQTVAKALS